MSFSTESPTPWSYEFDEEESIWVIVDSDGNDVAHLSFYCEKGVADLIAKAVNKYTE